MKISTSTILETTSILTTSSSSSTSLSCVNQASDRICTYFASMYGYCGKTVYLNKLLFSVACKKTCNMCAVLSETTTKALATTMLTNCVDRQTSCSIWVIYCNFLISFNPHPCPKTCNICTTQPTTTATTTTSKASCVDIASECSAWVNYCYLLVNQNPHLCAKTCKLC